MLNFKTQIPRCVQFQASLIIKMHLPLVCFEAASQYFVYQYPSRANLISVSIL